MTNLARSLPISADTADDLAQAIIDSASIRTATSIRNNVYVIGNYSGRINFYAQQTRALNLVWALVQKEYIREGDRIGIVGGGLAGVMAAIALLQKGAEPELFEQYSVLFRYQRNTVTRHVHPTVNYWPEIPISPSSDFPFLNWYEDNPCDIITSIENEIYRRFRILIPQTSYDVVDLKSGPAAGVYLSCQVVDLTSDPGAGLYLTVKRSAGDCGPQIGPYVAVIIACGFGLEERPPGLPAGVPYSYWHNDDVLPPAAPDWSSEHVFISGAGDGGLIDVIRAGLHRFDNGREIITLAKLMDTPATKQVLDKLSKLEQPNAEKYWSNPDSFAAYENLPLHKNFKDRLKGNLSSGFDITLNSKYQGIFSPTSSIIHRIIVAQLVKLHRVHTKIGNLLEVEWSQPARLQVGRENPDGSKHVTWEGEATRVIVRHGGKGSLDWLHLTPSEREALKVLQRQNFANSLRKGWREIPGFFDNPKNFPKFLGYNYLDYYKPRAHQFLARNGGSVGIAQDNGRYYYRVFCDSEAAEAELPNTFFGVRVSGEVRPPELRAQGSYPNGDLGGGRAPPMFVPGAKVQYSEAGAYSTLTCFATVEGEVGAIVPLHSWSGDRENPGISFISGSDVPSSTTAVRLLRTASLGRAQSDGRGGDDVGVVSVPPYLRPIPSPSGDIRWLRFARRKEIFDHLDEEVLKAGATSGLTVGILEMCELTKFPVHYTRGIVEYEGLMGIRSRGPDPFSQPGDSGAAVFSRKGILLGMILAGSGELTLAIPIADVFRALRCSPLLDQ